MRSLNNQDTWLKEYDQAITQAEKLKVSKVLQPNDVKLDFLGAIMKIAPI